MTDSDSGKPPAATRRLILLLALISEGGLGGAALLLGWLFGQWPFAHWQWSWNQVAVGAAASLPMLALFLVILRWPVGPLRSIKRFAEQVIRPVFQSCTLWDLALISLLAGIGEEMFFRGVVQPVLSDWLGLWTGIAVASLLFGLAHPITPLYVLLAAALGFYLGWLWLVTDNLLVVIAAHAIYDLAALWFVTDEARPAPA
jgi:membrane protease YdiL (CAAX protease family)